MSVTRVPNTQHAFEIGGMGAAVPAPPPAEAPSPTPSATRTAATSTGAKLLTARQILAQLRARLREVKREIAARKQLERERDQLQRLIQAATNERDNVRRLRAAG